MNDYMQTPIDAYVSSLVVVEPDASDCGPLPQPIPFEESHDMETLAALKLAETLPIINIDVRR